MPDPVAPGAFSDYARVYDAIYADKDSASEASFVMARLGDGGGRLPSTLLEVGCGTGRHLSEFVRHGAQVTAIDRSAEMAAIARGRAIPGVEVVVDDARSFVLEKTFAAAVALFHVVSYLTTADDLAACFAAVRRHLVAGAPFLFDFWHLPGVRLDPPSRRERSFTVEEGSFHRSMLPTWRDPVVDLDIEIDGDLCGRPVRIRERHLLRAWSRTELAVALEATGFTTNGWGAGLGSGALVERDWHGWALARAR